MSRGVRDVFILAGFLALYGLALWAFESVEQRGKLAEFDSDPRAIFARDHDRDRMIEQENDAPTFTPPADDMLGTIEGKADDASID